MPPRTAAQQAEAAAAAQAQASAYQRAQSAVASAAALAAIREWRQIDGKNLDLSWLHILGRLLAVTGAAQVKAADAAMSYLGRILKLTAAEPSGARLSADAFRGLTGDGRPMGTLLYTPVALSKQKIGQGERIADVLKAQEVHLAMLVKTQVQDAGRMGLQSQMAAEPKYRGYVRKVTLPACARCIILSGRFYRYSHGFLRHPNCVPAGTVVSGPRRLGATRRFYQGELTVITTASGKELAITGNHPVLTDRGWVPANLLDEGSYVVRSTLAQGAQPLVIPGEYEVPSLVEDLWSTDLVGSLLKVPTSAEDFHGDGMDGEVDVVLADRLLRDDGEAALFEPEHELTFAAGVASAATLAGGGAFDEPFGRELDAAYGVVGSLSLGCAFCGGHLGGAELSGVRTVARWDATGDYGTTEGVASYAGRGADLVGRLAGQVELDRVIELRRVSWSDHVYNLTSAEGWYAANGLIVSNCDCTMIPVPVGSDWVDADEPQALFARMRAEHPARLRRSLTEGDLKALDHGADLNQVVNAHRGLVTANVYGRKGVRVTTEATTKRGIAGRRLIKEGGAKRPPGSRYSSARSPRLTPAQIFYEAEREGWDRDEIVRQLKRFGFIIM